MYCFFFNVHILLKYALQKQVLLYSVINGGGIKRFCKSWLITLVSFFAMPFANSRQELKRELP